MPVTHRARGPIRAVRHVEPKRIPAKKVCGHWRTRRAWLVVLECGHSVMVQSEPGQRAYCGECHEAD